MTSSISISYSVALIFLTGTEQVPKRILRDLARLDDHFVQLVHSCDRQKELRMCLKLEINELAA